MNSARSSRFAARICTRLGAKVGVQGFISTAHAVVSHTRHGWTISASVKPKPWQWHTLHRARLPNRHQRNQELKEANREKLCAHTKRPACWVAPAASQKGIEMFVVNIQYLNQPIRCKPASVIFLSH